jgi:glycosyltransferase involved in cell wall biosynthesis
MVVASDFGGVRESLPASLHEYLYTPGSVDELTERLSSVMKLTANEARALGRLGRGFVETNYDIRTINQRLLAAAATASVPRQALHSAL